jgi:hypothetical protein
MSDHQTQGLLLLAIGLATLMVSVDIAWTLSRGSRTRRGEGAGCITVVSFVLFEGVSKLGM